MTIPPTISQPRVSVSPKRIEGLKPQPSNRDRSGEPFVSVSPKRIEGLKRGLSVAEQMRLVYCFSIP